MRSVAAVGQGKRADGYGEHNRQAGQGNGKYAHAHAHPRSDRETGARCLWVSFTEAGCSFTHSLLCDSRVPVLWIANGDVGVWSRGQAHIRAATEGENVDQNSHPFIFDDHDGGKVRGV